MKEKLLLLFLIVIFLLFTILQAMSQAVIHGTIKDQDGRPVQNANVLLLKSLDSSLVKGTISDSSGKYSFVNIAQGAYRVTASFSGMEPIFTKVFDITPGKDRIDLGVLNLKNTDVRLRDITIAVKKPMFEQKIDRMVINVKNSITNAAGTALDVLEKSPGVTVNRQNNSIAINGKSGVTVMINNKITYMPMDALVELLAGMPAGNIEKLELITTPPSKYDAGGNGGFINIVLINNPYAGFSGSYFLTGGYGIRETGAAGLNFNYRGAKINLYGNYAFNHDHNLQPTTAFTQFTKGGNIITNNSFSDRDAFTEVHNARIGIDYQVDTATIIGALVSGYDRRWTMIAHNGVTTSKNNVPDTIITSVDNPELNHWQNIMANLNFQHTFKPGRILFADANYIYYKDNNPNTYSTNYYNGAKEFLYHEDSRGAKITPINFRVFSTDYITPLSGKINMEAGAKISLSKFTNDVSVENLKQDIWIADSGLSAKYVLKENIGAVYTSFQVNFTSSTSMTAGLRYEYTNSNLGTTEIANIVDRKYGEFFPTFSVSQKLDGDNRINFSYSKRITRPTFNDLAPFTVFFDPKTFYSGNPALQPAIANSVQGSYVFKNFSATITYTHEKNTIDNFYFQTQRVDTISNIVYLSSRNYKSEQYFTASFSLPFMVTKWWTMQNNINLDWRQINTAYNNTPVRLRNWDYNINSTQRFTLPGNVSFELSALYYSAYYVGTAKQKPLYRADAGLQKKLSNNKDILRFTANDIFNSGGKYRFGERLSTGAIVNRIFAFQTVAYKLTYTHNFGNRALKDKRERLTGAEDELKRVN